MEKAELLSRQADTNLIKMRKSMRNQKRNFFIILLLLSISLNASQIYLNKSGYLLNSTKIVFFSTATDSFFVKDVTNKLILKGKTEISRTNDPSTGMTIYKGNFSTVNQAGYYFMFRRYGSWPESFIDRSKHPRHVVCLQISGVRSG